MLIPAGLPGGYYHFESHYIQRSPANFDPTLTPLALSVTEITQLAILFTPGSERRLKKSSYCAKFKNQLVQLNNFSSAHHIVLSIEDRVDFHCWLKPPHKCTIKVPPNLLCGRHCLPLLMSRHADRSSSFLYLADLRYMQYGCKFATVCDRKG